MAGGKLVLAVAGKRTQQKRYYRKKRNTSYKRAQGRATHYRWFKDVTAVPSSTAGEIFNVYRPRDLTQNTGDLGQTFMKYASFWSQYRCTKVIVKLFPAGVGSESLQGQAGQPLFKRGDIVTWINQDDSAQGAPNGINKIIGRNSSRLRNARKYFKLYANRPNNFPIWGDIDGTFAAPVINFVDTWNASLCTYGDNFTASTAPGSQVFYWAFVYYKVEFKGMKH